MVKICLRYISLIIIFLHISEAIGFAQALFSTEISDSSAVKQANTINYGFDKIVNTYIFRSLANINTKVLGGEINLIQLYKGEKITSFQNLFRDDENLIFNYKTKLINDFSISANQYWAYNSLSKVQELKTTGGILYKLNENFNIESSGGFEENSMSDNKGSGPVLELNSGLNKFNIEDYIIDANLNGEYVKLNDNRMRTLFNISGSMYKKYDEYNDLRLDVRYRSFLYPESFSEIDKRSIFNRLEKTYSTFLNANFALSDKFFGTINIALDNKDKYRSYSLFLPTSSKTGIETKRNEFQMNFSGELRFISGTFFQSVSMGYNVKDDRNTADMKNKIDEIEFAKFQSEQNMLDNLGSTTLLKTNTLWKISKSDSLNFNFIISLFRYDTPSNEINDDRDRFATIFNLRFSHRFSSILTAWVESNVHLEHLVYIKAAKSANNRWSRIISLNPGISINTKKFSMNPSFEIQANYTSYDFEYMSTEIESMSIRDIGYNDSIFIYLTDKLNLISNLKIRFFENSWLFWDSFSESPQDNQFEQFSKIMIYEQAKENISLGFGLRFYMLKQKNISAYALSTNNVNHYSFAPETEIRIYNLSGVNFYIEGWYEFQTIYSGKGIEYREVPNIFLNTNIQL
jgi:hypothetical protein